MRQYGQYVKKKNANKIELGVPFASFHATGYYFGVLDVGTEVTKIV